MNVERLSPNYRLFLTLLHEEQVEYLLVGGFAVRYYGYGRETRDLDIWAAANIGNAMKLLDVCQACSGGIEGLTVEQFEHPNRIISIEYPPVRVEILNPVAGRRPDVAAAYSGERVDRIEILTVQSGIDFVACYPQRSSGILEGLPVNIISLEHLKRSKRASGRPNDLADVEHLT